MNIMNKDDRLLAPERLKSLRALEIIDTRPERAFDDLVRLAAQACDAPTALVSLVEADRQWFKARVGTDLTETDLTRSVCAHVVREERTLIIPDTTADARTRANPLNEECGMRFYAGVPLTGREGHVYGSLCVLDTTPRTLSDAQLFALDTLAAQVVIQLEMRQALKEAEDALARQEVLRQEIDHRVKNSLQQVAVFLRLQKRASDNPAAAEALDAALVRVNAIATVHDGLGRLAADHEVGVDDFLAVFLEGLAPTIPERITLSPEIAAVRVATRHATSLAIIVNEFVANAVKHAFEPGQAGRITVSLTREADVLVFQIADDGRGMPVEQQAGTGGLGLRIMEVSAQSLSATLSRPTMPRGSALRLEMPRADIEISHG